jgi:ADP-dependent phosphofructokinase/glucokinase
MSTETRKLNEDEIKMLFTIVEATKRESFIYTLPAVHAPLMQHGYVEINPEIINENGTATRALKEGVKQVTLLQWEDAKATLEFAKAEEMRLRKEVVDLFADESKLKGTENVELEDGAKLKIVKKLNYKLDSDIEKVETALDKIEALGAEGKFIADRLVKWTADLSVSEYNKLDELGEDGAKYKAIIDEVLEIKSGAPTVELVEPKTKK